MVSGWSAPSCTSRSPGSPAGSGESSGNTRIDVSRSGLTAPSPYRSSNRLAPTDTVTVSPSAGTPGPSTSLSNGGGPTPGAGAGAPGLLHAMEREATADQPKISVRVRPGAADQHSSGQRGTGRPGRGSAQEMTPADVH